MATLQLLNCNYLNNKYENTIDFENLETQTSYFDELVFNSLDLGDDYVYIREHNAVMVEFAKETLEGVNYLRFRNANKWWYAFIVAKDYINEYTTNITFEIDVMQTFMFDYEILKSLIKREHQDRFKLDVVNTQRIFNTQSESLDYGENYKLVNAEIVYPSPYQNIKEILSINKIYFLSVTGSPDFLKFSEEPEGWRSPLRTIIIPFIYRPGQTFVDGRLETDTLRLHSATSSKTYNCLSLDEIFSKVIMGSNSIYSVTILPYVPIYNLTTENQYVDLYVNEPIYELTNSNVTIGVIGDITEQTPFRIDSISNPSKLNITSLSIEDKPNIELESKLYTNPYYYHLLTDNNNQPKIFKNEYLQSGRIEFNHFTSIEGIIKDKTGITGYELDDLIDSNQFLRINNCEMPLLSDAWLNYYNNNKATIQSGIAMSVQQGAIRGLSGTIQMGMGNPFGVVSIVEGIGSSVRDVEQTLIKRADIKQTPDSIRSVGNGAQYYLQSNKVYFQFLTYSITDEYRNILFEFFQKYGYLCNQIKKPDLKSRYYYNFIQTVGAIIKSDIDDEYINKIKNILNNGITFWHYRDKATFKGVNNYDYENLEMSALKYMEENKE